MGRARLRLRWLSVIRTRKSWRLSLALAAVIALALLPIALFTAWRVQADVREERLLVERALSQSAASLAQSAAQELQSSLDALAVLARSEIFQQDRIRTMGRLLQGRPRRDWDSLFLLDRRGAVVLDTAAARPADESVAEMAQLHARVLRENKPLVATHASAPEPGVVIALPIVQNGELHYVLGARITRTAWQRVVDGALVPDGGRALLVDDTRHVIAATSVAPTSPVGHSASAPIALAGWGAFVAIDGAPLASRQEAIVRNALATSGVSLLLGLILAGLAAWRIAFVPARRAPAEL